MANPLVPRNNHNFTFLGKLHICKAANKIKLNKSHKPIFESSKILFPGKLL